MGVERHRAQDATEAVHLCCQDCEHELAQSGAVHLPAVERAQAEHGLALTTALERSHDEHEGECRERDRLADLNAAEVALAQRDDGEQGNRHRQPDEADGDHQRTGQHGLATRSWLEPHQTCRLAVETEREAERRVHDEVDP